MYMLALLLNKTVCLSCKQIACGHFVYMYIFIPRKELFYIGMSFSLNKSRGLT